VVVIGTLYKDMKLKPSILDEYSKDPALKQVGASCPSKLFPNMI